MYTKARIFWLSTKFSALRKVQTSKFDLNIIHKAKPTAYSQQLKQQGLYRRDDVSALRAHNTNKASVMSCVQIAYIGCQQWLYVCLCLC